LWALGIALVGVPGLAWGPASKAEVEALYKAALERPGDDQAFRKYLEALPRYRNRYVTEGDVLRSEQQVREDLAARARAGQAQRGGELIVNTENGVETYWKELAARTLTYAVDRSSFSCASDYARVVKDLDEATGDWELACADCKVDFVHKRDLDAAPSHESVTFIVRQVDAQGQFIAAAFFPNDAPADRFVDIDPSYYATEIETRGVLRHELGHVLGYRHEHIRGVAGCFQENAAWKPLTPYDSQSVMHYFCGGGGNGRLELSDPDKLGHKSLYTRQQP
jgi:Matrixin